MRSELNLLSNDGSQSWIRISSGLNNFVRYLTDKIRIHEDNEDTLASMVRLHNSRLESCGKFSNKCRQTCSQSRHHLLPHHLLQLVFQVVQKHGMDAEPRGQRHQSYPNAKRMNTLLRHEPLPRDEDGAIAFWRLKMEFVSGFPNSVYWSIRTWIDHLQRGGGQKKRFQYCTDSTREETLYLRAIRGHSGENPMDPSLQDNVLIPDNFFEYIYHVGCSFNLHSIITSGLIAGGKMSSRDRQPVFFTPVNPLATRCQEKKEVDLTKPRFAAYKQQWRVHQNSVYWVDIKLAQRKGLTFYHSRSNANILYDTLPPICIERLVSTKTQEVVHNKIYRSPRPVPRGTLGDIWRKDWNSDAAASKQQQHPTNPIQKKPIRKHGETRNSVESCRVWSRKRQNTSEHVRKDNVQCDQARMGRPVACDVGTLDFRIQVLLRNTVKKSRVRTRS